MEREKRAPGRPRTREEGESRRYVGFTVPLKLKDDLEAAAKANRQSLSAEAVSRLEQSFHPLLPLEDLKQAMTLLWIYRREGRRALNRYLINVVEGSAERPTLVAAEVDASPGPQTEFLPADEPREIFEYDDENKLVSVVARDKEGKLITIVKRDDEGNYIVVYPPAAPAAGERPQKAPPRDENAA